MELRRQRIRVDFVFLIFTLIIFLFFYYNLPSLPEIQPEKEKVPSVNSLSTSEKLQAEDSVPCTKIGSLRYDDPKLISCLKLKYLFEPSNLPYNLANPDQENPTQHGQNVIALKLLQHKRNGFFVECGALNGELYSNTLYLERQFGWTGLLIEAESNNYKELVLKHRHAWTSPTCLSPKSTAGKLTLAGLDYQAGSGLTLMKNSVPLREFPGFLDAKSPSAEVQCFPLFTYLLALNQTVVDYFSLDVEGADFEILKTIPFDKVIFLVLEVEVRWVTEGPEAVKAFLEERGYIFVKEIVVDYIFVHKSLKLPKYWNV